MKTRVVVTGRGIICPLGPNLSAIWKKLAAGHSQLSLLNGGEQGTTVVPLGKVIELPATENATYRGDRVSRLALEAAQEAVAEAKIDWNKEKCESVGVVIGCSKGGMRSFEHNYTLFTQNGLKAITENFLFDYLPSTPATAVAELFALGGPRLNIVAACATGTEAIIRGVNLIKDGDTEVVIAGSSESSLTPLVINAFHKMGLLAVPDTIPPTTFRPFDRRRCGFFPGEGAGVVILEKLEHALKRGVTIQGEIVGYAQMSDAYNLVRFHPEGESVAKGIKTALIRSEIVPEKLDYVHAHATATLENDRMETIALKKALGKHAYRVAISATKPITGHLLGASGSIEFIFSLLAMEHNFIPPTINLTENDPECDLNYTPGKGVEREINYAMKTAFGFGGHIGILVLRRYN